MIRSVTDKWIKEGRNVSSSFVIDWSRVPTIKQLFSTRPFRTSSFCLVTPQSPRALLSSYGQNEVALVSSWLYGRVCRRALPFSLAYACKVPGYFCSHTTRKTSDTYYHPLQKKKKKKWGWLHAPNRAENRFHGQWIVSVAENQHLKFSL